ncbi:hypothetical protein F4861DRAFT_538895 [Xylaria intraflava]|nr:hypothetical protein F4861DRAFT_538895 [Xylaria intraflava]
MATASMETPDRIIDPDGDLLIILQSSSVVFPQLQRGADEPGLSELESNIANAGTSEADTDQEAPLKECRFKASSKHLALACPHFKKMMSGPWSETKIHDDGLRHWVLEGFEENAMVIVLNAIHGLNRKVPRTIELSALSEIARIVDYLGCHEAVELLTELWIRHLQGCVPTSYCNDTLLWICIAGVFQVSDTFMDCTRLAILESDGNMDTLGLPILSRIDDHIDRRRIEHLDFIFKSLYDLIDQLSTSVKCGFACDSRE